MLDTQDFGSTSFSGRTAPRKEMRSTSGLFIWKIWGCGWGISSDGRSLSFIAQSAESKYRWARRDRIPCFNSRYRTIIDGRGEIEASLREVETTGDDVALREGSVCETPARWTKLRLDGDSPLDGVVVILRSCYVGDRYKKVWDFCATMNIGHYN